MLPTKPGRKKQAQTQICYTRRITFWIYTQFDACILFMRMLELEKRDSAIQAIEQNLIESNNGLFLRAVQTTEGRDGF